MFQFRIFPGLIFSVVVSACTLDGTEPAKQALPHPLSKSIQEIEKANNSDTRQKLAYSLYNQLRDTHDIPFVRDTVAVFLYYGEASSVKWNGDFNGWGRDTVSVHKTLRIKGTDLWYSIYSFPMDARFDYKIVVDQKHWILDPANNRMQWGGAGPNSELMMPHWKASPYESDPIKKGRVLGPYRLFSKETGYSIQYQVYLPYGFSASNTYPVLITTDGHEYFDSRLGNLPSITDYLIETGLTEPFIIIGVDPRNPDNLNENRRIKEFAGNAFFARFIAYELLPFIRGQFPVTEKAEKIGLIGTSLGGVFTLYMLTNYHKQIGNFAAQSPAIWYLTDLFDWISTSSIGNKNVYISAGTYFDRVEDTRKLEALLTKKSVNLQYTETNEGHSWGNWSARIHEPLIFFYGTDEPD